MLPVSIENVTTWCEKRLNITPIACCRQNTNNPVTPLEAYKINIPHYLPITRKTKLLQGTNGDETEISIFPVQLATRRIGSHTRLTPSLLKAITTHTERDPVFIEILVR